MMIIKKFAPLFIILAGMLWSTAGIFVRNFEKNGIHAMDIAALRSLITALVLGVFLLIHNHKILKIKWKDLWCFLGTGILSIAFFNLCYFYTITKTSLSIAATLLYSAPIIVMVLSVILFKEKLTKDKILAIILAFGGCVLVTGILADNAAVSIFGIIAGLGSGLGYALYSIFGRYALEKGYRPITITVYTFIFASIGSLPFTNMKSVGKVFINTSGLGVCILAFSLIATILPYLIYTIGLSYIESGSASIMASVEPVFATIIGVIVFHENLSFMGFIGISMVILSIVLLNRKGLQKAGHAGKLIDVKQE